ncbi:TIGR01620 family protein [Rhizobium sp. AQ_MP]|uniref:YcjF family protein n=1 Tax=Rhizobium sp. AQ_MP TaxID=2761536 RepID=UPI00163A1386|nr:TIGR01620 family protein [Rhizobium sp. AQ_MP]MBC2773241.1 TIGR01620 family protein [Rhizobium sp. AQ_MP]
MKKPTVPPTGTSGTPGPDLRRRPAAFTVKQDANPGRTAETINRPPRSFAGEVVIVPDEEDPFFTAADELPSVPVAEPRRRRFSFAKLATGAFGLLLSLAFGLWVDGLVRDLFARADWLGYLALSALAVGLVALAVAVGRELVGLWRLDAVQDLKAEADAAAESGKRKQAAAVVKKLTNLVTHRAETARGQKTLAAIEDDIIDAPHLIELAERELLAPLDAKARALILNSAKRVSVVTAVSPRAVVDLAYVLFEVVRLVRAMADLYGGRPGSFGMLRLLRDVFAHLAVTGSIAIGDGLAQQVLGHGLAARLSTRLGEGVINGLMTARIGIAAMDLCRPLPFRAAKRPGIGDFIGDLTPSMTGKDRDRNG